MTLGVSNAASCAYGIKMYVFGGRGGNNVVGNGISAAQVRTTIRSLLSENPVPGFC
jgi:hypothetical protein